MAPPASPSNPYKKQIDAVQHIYECAARPKPDATASDSTPLAVPSEPALASTSATQASAAQGGAFSEDDDDDDSSLSESSDEPSDESSDEDGEDDENDDAEPQSVSQGVVNLRANRGERPAFKLPGDEELEDIRPFLKEFLPKLKAANQELEAQKAAGSLQTAEIVGDEEELGEEQYIEMNLGLGVLEEKDNDADHDSNDQSKRDDADQQAQEKDILGKLMGREKPAEPVGIQEVADAQPKT